MSANERVVLVDGYAQIYRFFYAVRHLSDHAGRPTSALFGMARFMMKLDDDVPHTHAAVVFDLGKCEKRTAILPSYKATRPPMPDDLRSQVPLVRRWVELMGGHTVERQGVEADDLICGIVGQRGDRDTVIVSHDKDLAQLVAEGVVMLMPGRRGSDTVLDRDAVVAKFGIPPGAIRDYLALVGDSVDNIEGVAGVGPKTAASLLEEHGSIEELLTRLDQVSKDSLRDKLRSSEALLRRNLELVALEPELPETWAGLDSIRRAEPQWQNALEMALEYDLKSVARDIEKRLHDQRSPTLF